MVDAEEKPLFWIASCKKDLLAFPADVRDVIGYALDAFQKRSPKGIATARVDLDRIKRRLKTVEDMHAEWLKERQGNDKAQG